MTRQSMAALLRAEIAIYVAATRYVEAATNDVGFSFEPTDLRPALALLHVDPDVLTCGYTTQELIIAAAGSGVRIIALYVLVRTIKLLHPLLKVTNRLRSDWMKPAADEVVVLLTLVVVMAAAIARSLSA